MGDITVALVNTHLARRLEAKASNATINRELAWLKHMFNLAIRAGKLMTKPHIVLLREANARQGFFEPEQYQAVLSRLPEDLRPVVQFAYLPRFPRCLGAIGLPLDYVPGPRVSELPQARTDTAISRSRTQC
jgi:hypothetical protein